MTSWAGGSSDYWERVVVKIVHVYVCLPVSNRNLTSIMKVSVDFANYDFVIIVYK